MPEDNRTSSFSLFGFAGALFLVSGLCLLLVAGISYFAGETLLLLGSQPATVGSAVRPPANTGVQPGALPALAGAAPLPHDPSSPAYAEPAFEPQAGESGTLGAAIAGALLPESPLGGEDAAFTLPEPGADIEQGSDAVSPVDPMAFRISVPELSLNAEVQPVGLFERSLGEGSVYQWAVPREYAAGWHDGSAPPGRPGNTVLNGHNNIYGGIFAKLADLPLQAQIVLSYEGHAYTYQVVARQLLPERGQSLAVRLENAQWIAPTTDQRLTIVTCWPNTTNSHRLVVVAELSSIDGVAELTELDQEE